MSKVKEICFIALGSIGAVLLIAAFVQAWLAGLGEDTDPDPCRFEQLRLRRIRLFSMQEALLIKP